jgi:hypothetical protein
MLCVAVELTRGGVSAWFVRAPRVVPTGTVRRRLDIARERAWGTIGQCLRASWGLFHVQRRFRVGMTLQSAVLFARFVTLLLLTRFT